MLYILDYGAGSEYGIRAFDHCPWTDGHASLADVRSLANSIRKLGFEFEWVKSPEDIDKADVSVQYLIRSRDLAAVAHLP